MEHRTEKITFRVTPAELDFLQGKINGTNYKMSEFVRSSAFDKEIIIVDGAKELVRELKAIGRNINQLTVLSSQGLIKTVNFTSVNERLANIWQSLN